MLKRCSGIKKIGDHSLSPTNLISGFFIPHLDSQFYWLAAACNLRQMPNSFRVPLTTIKGRIQNLDTPNSINLFDLIVPYKQND